MNAEAAGGDSSPSDEDRADKLTSLVAEAHLTLATLSAILVDLSQSYHEIVSGGGGGGCLRGLMCAGQLDIVVQVCRCCVR